MTDECNPQTPCEIKNNEDKKPNLDVNDPRSYCFDLASNTGDVCLPKSCNIVKKKSRGSGADETSKTAKKPAKYLPIKQAVKTCIPWKGINLLNIYSTRK